MNQLYLEAKKLINSDGNVWLWKTESMENVRHFLTIEDAQKYFGLHHQMSRENGRTEEAYSIGTKADFMAAAKEFERQKKANEVKAYCKHVDALIECKQREIKALNGLAEVCREFDGKVINKRFHEAVKEATGFYSSFHESWLVLNPGTNRIPVEYRPDVSVFVDWSRGYNCYTGEKKEITPNAWQWNTGDRLEAEKAIAVIESHINTRLAKIDDLEASKKQYAAYLKLARKAEKIFKEMEGYNNTIREFAKNKALSQHNCLTNFWRTY